jgi:arsenite methyltransferase
VQSSRVLKKSVAAVYETDTFNSFLKDVLHPGGLELTKRAAEIALVNENSRVLDMACGRGESSLLLVEKYGCSVVGIDISDKKTALAQTRAKARGLDDRVKFITADAENLPFRNTIFDIVLSECSFSILPDKEKAASEMKRVLKANGRLVITDITLRGKITPESQSEIQFACQASLPFFPCVTGAMPIEDYTAILGRAGFQNSYTEDQSIQLRKLSYQMGITFGGWEGFLHRLSTELFPGSDGIKESASFAKAYRSLFKHGRPGYVLIIAGKP